MTNLQYVAPCLFGLEGIAGDELRRLGMENVKVEDRRVLFTGDTLFAGACGRTDLPGGSWETITQSLAFLRSLNAPYQVFPGHGQATTLEREKAVNPYLRG